MFTFAIALILACLTLFLQKGVKIDQMIIYNRQKVRYFPGSHFFKNILRLFYLPSCESSIDFSNSPSLVSSVLSAYFGLSISL